MPDEKRHGRDRSSPILKTDPLPGPCKGGEAPVLASPVDRAIRLHPVIGRLMTVRAYARGPVLVAARKRGGRVP